MVLRESRSTPNISIRSASSVTTVGSPTVCRHRVRLRAGAALELLADSKRHLVRRAPTSAWLIKAMFAA
jgi:hypothetical protein